MTVCGLDFGTSNSAIGVLRNGAPVLAPLDGAVTLAPSAIFFDYETPAIYYGREAVAASIAQIEGRLLRALKSILSSSLINETTVVNKRRVPLTDVVEMFVRHLKTKAETFLGEPITSVVHGRPVHFVDGDDTADARAEDVLAGIARRVGFKEVQFVYEPIAAAAHYEAGVAREELVLVADIGGGTSDIAVIRVGPERRRRADRRDDILASGGIRLGGTDFDTALSLDAVMPLLGLGTQLVAKDLPMPRRLFHELASWATINFVYTRANADEARALAAGAKEPRKLQRLVKAIVARLGHRIAFSVEDAKIALSDAEKTEIGLAFLEEKLAAPASKKAFGAAIAGRIERLREVTASSIEAAGVRPDQINTIFLTGGSCRVPAVRQAIAEAAPSARIAGDSDLLSVALGLTEQARHLA